MVAFKIFLLSRSSIFLLTLMLLSNTNSLVLGSKIGRVERTPRIRGSRNTIALSNINEDSSNYETRETNEVDFTPIKFIIEKLQERYTSAFGSSSFEEQEQSPPESTSENVNQPLNVEETVNATINLDEENFMEVYNNSSNFSSFFSIGSNEFANLDDAVDMEQDDTDNDDRNIVYAENQPENPYFSSPPAHCSAGLFHYVKLNDDRQVELDYFVNVDTGHCVVIDKRCPSFFAPEKIDYSHCAAHCLLPEALNPC